MPPAVAASDETLARRAGLGDRDAFAVLVRRLGDPCWTLALHTLAGRADLAERALERAWTLAWHGVPGYDGRPAFGLWLLAIVARSCERVEEPPGDEAPAEVSGEQVLRLALARLPWALRTAWVLHEVQGYSTRDTALVLDLPELVARQVLVQARAQLLAELRER